MKPGRLGTMTHDYKRNGTTTLFAALDVLDGQVIGRCMQRHRHQEFIRFLNGIERQVPAGKVIHVILDNYAAHKHPNVRRWLARHPRWIFHFTPTSCSWLNAVEGFFARLTRRRLKRGVFPSLVALQEAINRFIDHHNQQPKPFTWKADPKDIIAAAKRGHQTLQTIQLVKEYPSGSVIEVRTITKPVAGTVKVYLDGVEQLSGWSVDTTTGLVTFGTPPALGVEVTADFEFDVPVRFDTDHMAVTIESYRLHAWQQIPIVELRT